MKWPKTILTCNFNWTSNTGAYIRKIIITPYYWSISFLVQPGSIEIWRWNIQSICQPWRNTSSQILSLVLFLPSDIQIHRSNSLFFFKHTRKNPETQRNKRLKTLHKWLTPFQNDSEVCESFTVLIKSSLLTYCQ
jgi:hypothetical protein